MLVRNSAWLIPSKTNVRIHAIPVKKAVNRISVGNPVKHTKKIPYRKGDLIALTLNVKHTHIGGFGARIQA